MAFNSKEMILTAVALAALAAAASAGQLAQPFTVHGRVYCDTCRCGFETNVTTYIPKAKVQIQCKGKDDVSVVYKADGETDHTGSYTITVPEDHGDQICDSVLVSSPWSHCMKPDPGRNRARVIVTNFNGVGSPKRHANNMGFLMDHTLPVCAKLLNFYLHSDE